MFVNGGHVKQLYKFSRRTLIFDYVKQEQTLYQVLNVKTAAK